jgi:hypothetical protein
LVPGRGATGPAGADALALRIALVVVVVFGVYLLDLDELQAGILDATLGVAVWQMLASRPDVDEMILLAASGSEVFIRTFAAGGRSEIAIVPNSGLVLRIAPASGASRLSESDGVVFRLALVGIAIWFVHQLGLNGFLTGLLDAILGILAWDILTSRRDIDQTILMAVTRADVSIHADPPQARNELATLFAAIVAIALVIGRASVMPLADKIARRRAFMRRMDRRDNSFHYTCDQFWLRIQGR